MMISRTLLKVMFVFAAAFLLIVTGREAGAQSIPPGSYKQSCRDIKIKGNRLSAYCRAIDGSESLTTLNNADLCEGDISNNNGNLTCKKPPLQALKVRGFLYYLGGKYGSITPQTRSIKQNTTETIAANEAENCFNNNCKYYFGIVVDRKLGKESLSPYATISVKTSPGVGGGANVFFKPGEYKGTAVLSVPLKMGENRLEIAVDPENKIREENKADNRFKVTVIVSP